MKIKIIIVGMLTLFFSSCTESFLELPSESSLSTPIYFQTEADFESAVNGIYAPMRVWFGPNTDVSTSPAILIGDMHSDNSRYVLNPNYRATGGAEGAADFIYDSQQFSSYWNDFYSWISRANQIIALIDGVDFDATSKSNIKGQALFLRAYSYWWLVRLYGDAILHLEPVTTLDGTSLPLSAEAEVVAQIIADATEAVSLLKNKADQEPGRVTKGSASMLLGEVHAWYKDWALAETAFKQISGYSLVANYADVFDPANKNNSESIFEIQYSASSADYASSFVYNMFPYPLSADQLQALTGIGNAQGLAEGEMFNTPTPELIAAYAEGDVRYDASIMFADDANGSTWPMCIKYLHPHSLYRQTDDNLFVYRYAEALLYLAEAVNEQGGRIDVAKGYLNQVRNRAGLENTDANSQEELREAILAERRVELAFEGKRWWDLVRTGKVNSVIAEYGAKVKAHPEDYYFQGGYLPVPTAFTNITSKFNIPDTEVLLNPLIE